MRRRGFGGVGSVRDMAVKVSEREGERGLKWVDVKVRGGKEWLVSFM